MTAVPTTRNEQISQLLGCTIEQLDIDEEGFRAAEQRYQDLAAHLAEKGAHIYVQGSFMLGTVVAPYGRWGEFDLDLVCRWDIAKRSTTQQQLKDRTGDYLREYLDSTDGADVEKPDACTDSRRCWTLHYVRFHMDVLPAIPNRDAWSSTAIELTDKQLRAWQQSDPLAYVQWFRSQCAQQFLAERKALAAAGAGSVDDVPAWRVRTPLHRVVQVLKRHRDVYFHDDPDDKPPSSLITTLAARAYAGQQDLLDATLQTVQRIPEHIERRGDVWWVENPVCERENFADKWNDYPLRRINFRRWLARVEEDLGELQTKADGTRAAHERLESAFGSTPVRKAVAAIGDQSRSLRTIGQLRMDRRGTLTGAAGIAVAEHRFFGDRPPA